MCGSISTSSADLDRSVKKLTEHHGNIFLLAVIYYAWLGIIALALGDYDGLASCLIIAAFFLAIFLIGEILQRKGVVHEW